MMREEGEGEEEEGPLLFLCWLRPPHCCSVYDSASPLLHYVLFYGKARGFGRRPVFLAPDPSLGNAMMLTVLQQRIEEEEEEKEGERTGA